MIPVKREELPELPDGWWWENAIYERGNGTVWKARGPFVDCYMRTNGLHVESDDNDACPISVISAVLFANGVTLPEVPGRSSLLGGK